LFLPEESEIQQVDLPESSWELVKRGGFISGSEQESIIHLRKKSIYMFAEGSVFKSGTRLKGKFTDLRPEWNPPLHPVYRCGMPVFIYI
jgi:CRISPR type III-A-associated RAMP protein Csm4